MELIILQFFARWVNLKNKIEHNNLCALRCFCKIKQNSLMTYFSIIDS